MGAYLVQLGCLVQACNQDTIMEVEDSFQKYTKKGGRVILKHDKRGKVVLQNDCVLVARLHLIHSQN
jgi:hypothetical protein